MKIGIVLTQPPAYSETFFISKIKGLLNSGFEVKLYVREASRDFELCTVVPAPTVSKNRLKQCFKMMFVYVSLLFYIKRVVKFIALERDSGRRITDIFKTIYLNAHVLKADMDWLHFGFATLAVNSENVAQAIGVKMAISCRGYDMDTYPLKHPGCYNLVWQRVDKVHAISQYMLIKAYENGLGHNIPTQIIFPAIDTSFFEDYNTEVSDFQHTLKFLTIARLHPVKGLEDTLKALSILKQKRVKFQYEIIGSGQELNHLNKLVKQLNLECKVNFLGQLPHSVTLDKLKETDIYIQYSISEGFCNAVLEAQAMGCLCVVSDGGALPENVIHNKTGWVVPSQSPEKLADQLLKIHSKDTLELVRIKSQAHERAVEEFSLEQQKLLFVDFYKV